MSILEMNKSLEQQQNLFIQKLQHELDSLQNFEKIEGIRKVSTIISELIDDPFTNEVSVLHNNQFQLVFLKEEEKIEFRTTYSNQVIDTDYMNKFLLLNQRQNIIGSLLQTINRF